MTDTNTTDINIRASADRVIALLEQNRAREAMQLLAREREGERLAVQEALDRYVAAGAQQQLSALQRPGSLSANDAAAMAPDLQRLQAARAAPRFPVVAVAANGEPDPRGTNELNGLSASQTYDIYASIVESRGTQPARDALDRQERVILGLRQENSTLATMDNLATRGVDESLTPSGKGVYDDRMIVLWKDANGNGHAQQLLRANTEPTAVYDHHAGSNGHRPFAHGDTERQRAASPGYESVRSPRKIEGEDVNGDGLRDLGRMREGTYEMEATTHAWPGLRGVTSFSLRPTAAAVRNGPLQVERDSNADGYFTTADVNGRQPLNQSFKIHLGSRGSTDSAGCQTIHVDDAREFIAAAQGAAGQTRWQYVLTSTTPGAARDVQVGPDVAPDAQRAPQRAAPPAHGDGPQRHAPPPAADDGHGERFPRGRADAAMFEAIHRQLPAGTSDAQAAHVMAQAKQNGIRDAHQLDRVAVVDGNAWVVGRTPGFLAKVDLSAPTPPLSESLRHSEQMDQQQAMERQQVAMSAPGMGGRGMA